MKVDGRKVAGRHERADRDRAGRSAQGVHAAGAGRSVPAGDGAGGGTDGRAAFRPGRGDVRGDDDRRSRAPARDARRHARRAAARREGDACCPPTGTCRRSSRRPAPPAGRRRSRRSTRSRPRVGCTSSARCAKPPSARERPAPARCCSWGSGRTRSPGTAWRRRWPSFATRASASLSSRSARATCPAPLARATAETGGEAIALRAFDESLPFLADALRPRPDHPALDARGEGEWHVLRTVTGGAVWIGRALERQIPADAETARADAGSPLATDLASLWDRARLEWHDRDAADEVAKVVTPVTSLLVLETEQDYRRFGLDVPQPIAMAAGRGGQAPQGRGGKDGQADLREQGGPVRPPGSERTTPIRQSRARSGRATRGRWVSSSSRTARTSRRSSAVTRRWARTPAASSVA